MFGIATPTSPSLCMLLVSISLQSNQSRGCRDPVFEPLGQEIPIPISFPNLHWKSVSMSPKYGQSKTKSHSGAPCHYEHPVEGVHDTHASTSSRQPPTTTTIPMMSTTLWDALISILDQTNIHRRRVPCAERRKGIHDTDVI